jgi:uncharacterized protein YfiM (DUF2279 family)
MLTNHLYGVGDDKIKHLEVSTFLGYTGETLLHKYSQLPDKKKVLYAVGAAFAVGVGKELYDEEDYGGFSIKDLIPDLFGAVTGAIVSNYLNKNYFLKIEHKSDKKISKISIAYKF